MEMKRQSWSCHFETAECPWQDDRYLEGTNLC